MERNNNVYDIRVNVGAQGQRKTYYVTLKNMNSGGVDMIVLDTGVRTLWVGST